jgi:hypothetical protein
VDGDGAYEVLFADENEFRIYDGATGMVNFSDDTHGSWTLWEYPVVSDVDNDGSAEIVVASNLNPDGVGFTGIVVYGHASNDWTKSGPTWGTHDFAVTNLNPDGSVPNPAPLSWNVHNLFRARPPIDDVGQADLIPVFGDYCVASCTDGPVRISYNVANQGALQAYAPVPVSLLTVDQGIETLIDTQYHWPIPPGRSVRGNIFELHPDQWGSGFIIRVDDDGFGNGAVDECDETNNEYAYYETLCY